MSKWLNKWIVPLLVAFLTLVALAISVFVSFGVHLIALVLLTLVRLDA